VASKSINEGSPDGGNAAGLLGFDVDRRLLLAAASGLSGAALTASVGGPALAATPGLTFSYVEGSGGVPLNMVQAGPADAPEILFVHGMSQSYLAFGPQLGSALTARFRLVAFDLRGHGNSGKPWRGEDYAGSRIWAEDVAAVIAAAKLKRPLVVAWSFGGNVCMDYVHHHGTDGLAGINLVSTLGGLVSIPPNPSPAFAKSWAELALRESPDIAENIDGFHRAASGLSAHLSQAQQDIAFATGMMQTGIARHAIKAKAPIDNSGLLASIAVPVLISVGTLDLFTPLTSAHQAAGALRQGQVSVYDDVGHFISAETPERFNRELAAFAVKAHT
jgi:pimeloyl-ACP methyl ester carboxylesterase